MKKIIFVTTVIISYATLCVTQPPTREKEIDQYLNEYFKRCGRILNPEERNRIMLETNGNQLLRLAISYQCPPLALRAFEYRADPNLKVLCVRLMPAYMRCLFIRSNATTYEFEDWQYEIIKILLSHPQFDKKDAASTLLIETIFRCDIKMIEILRDYGINPLIPLPLPPTFAHTQCTALEHLDFFEKAYQSNESFYDPDKKTSCNFPRIREFLRDWINETESASA